MKSSYNNPKNSKPISKLFYDDDEAELKQILKAFAVFGAWVSTVIILAIVVTTFCPWFNK